MELIGEVKLLGDGYAGGFSCGMSMCSSDTFWGLKKTGSADTGKERLDTYEDDRHHILKVHEKADNDAKRVFTEFVNGSDKEVSLEMIASFALSGVKADKIHRLLSFWSAEGKLRTETIEDLHLEKSWNGCSTRVFKFGNVGSMPVRKYFPFVALENSESGHIVGILMGLASSWQIEVSCKKTQEFLVMGGIADRDFGHWIKKLAPGESFITPDALIAEGSSLEEVCDKLVKAQHPDISPVDDHMGIMFNEYCTSWGNPTIDSIRKQADVLEGKGIQYFVIDSGWYGLKNDWAESVGNWEVNRDIFPNGMKEAADYIRSKGMIPGLWYEMEVVGPHSPYFDRTEYLLKKDGYPLTAAGRRFWDMENPWVIEHLSEKVIKHLKDCGFGYIKVDYNDSIGIGCDGGDSLGEALYNKVQGTRKFFKKMKEEIPDLVIENCSSGGHRLVYSMMAIASQASFSDAHETKAIPLIAANVHRVIRPDQTQVWAVLRKDDDRTRLEYSLINTFFGRMCLSGDIYDLADWQWDIVKAGMEFYDKAKDIIKYGTTTLQQYTTNSYNNPTGNQLYVRKWQDKELVLFHRFADSSDNTYVIPEGKRVLAEFGRAESDFSANAMIIGT